jgi:hypothetical protein
MFMGIRDLLRKRAKDDNYDQPKGGSPSIQKQSPSPSPAQLVPEHASKTETETAMPIVDKSESRKQVLHERAPVRMGEDPGTKTVNVQSLDSHESVQDRINRVKAGKMTEGEKEAFLDSVLTAGNTPESRKPLIRSSRGKSEGKLSKKESKASPFPSDSILRNLARGLNADSVQKSDFMEKTMLENQRKKKEYLEMVTDPDRFNRLSTTNSLQRSPGLYPQSGSSAAESKTPVSSLGGLQSSKNKYLPNPTGPPQEPVSPPDDLPLPGDLGARLGSAAMEHERLRQQAEEERREREWQQKEELRLEQERRAAEIAKRREEELDRREAEIRERRRRDQDNLSREENERKEAQQRRMRDMMKAQEEYWIKKLSRERESKAKTEIKKEVDTDEQEKDDTAQTTSTSPTARVQVPESSTRFNPDERSLLSDVSITWLRTGRQHDFLILSLWLEVQALNDHLADWDKNQDVIEKSAKRALGVSPSVSDVGYHKQSERDFMAEQARKKSEIERARQVQLEKLKALNSPLPTPRNSSFAPRAAPVFNPQRPVSASSPSSRHKLGNLVRGREGGSDQNSGSPSGSPLNSDDVNRRKTISKLNGATLGSGDSSWDRDQPQSGGSLEQPQSSAYQAEGKETRPPSSGESQNRGPIRMELPLLDVEYDQDEDGLDVRSNKAMSIADAMKRSNKGGSADQSERSKKWGIDMNRFN